MAVGETESEHVEHTLENLEGEGALLEGNGAGAGCSAKVGTGVKQGALNTRV